MKDKNWKLALLAFSLIGVMLTGSCQDSQSNQAHSLPAWVAPEEVIIVEQEVTVTSEGGSAQVQFVARGGDKISIRLKASRPDSEPYGYLEWPDGTGDYQPLNQTAQRGENSAEVTLKQTGTYVLTIFDGSNQGASVRVTVQVVP